MDDKQRQKIKEYNKLVQKISPKSDMQKGLLRAFWVGGVICAIGQLVSIFGSDKLGLDKDASAAFTAIVMVFFGSLLTGLGVYDKIGKYAGAGSIVPITGFANSIVAPAMEFRKEGLVMGVGAKLFSLAGPVLVYGICSSVAVGVIYWLIGR